jgi:hypothetical protein
MALDNVKAGRLILPIRSATASINKELEKQNDMLLTQVMQRHHMGISQILQAVNNPSLPPELKQFMVGWIDSASLLMSRILRNFGHDDISRMLPERKIVEQIEEQEGASSHGGNSKGNGAANAGGGSPEDTGKPAVLPAINAPTSKNSGVAVPAGGRDLSTVSV